MNVSEDKAVGSQIAMATANDGDLNPILVYDFTTDGNPDATFSLERSTGRLTLARRLDHETRAHYSVGIQVTDGKPDHTVAKFLDIYVDDENDNSPVFQRQSYEVRVMTYGQGLGLVHLFLLTYRSLRNLFYCTSQLNKTKK